MVEKEKSKSELTPQFHQLWLNQKRLGKEAARAQFMRLYLQMFF